MSKRAIAIIGGGIGGLATALCLSRSGVEVSVFERRKHLREEGAGLSLWPNGTAVLGHLGLLPEVARAGEVGTRFSVRSASGKLLMAINTAAADSPTVCLHRADLLGIIARDVPPKAIKLGRELVELKQKGHQARLRFDNGEDFVCDGVVGADGIHSQVRRMHSARALPVERGYQIFRGIAAPNPGLPAGENGESWGKGQRFGILGIGQDRVCWYATSNTFDPACGEKYRKRELERMFRGWHAPIPDLIDATDASSILCHPACDLRPFRNWGVDRTTLLGDAAHALTPNLGQGSSLALEDAFVLGTCLEAHADVAAAFRRYESLRFGRTRSVALRSRLLGWIGQWENRFLVPVRDQIAAFLPAKMFECHSSGATLLRAISGC